MKSRAVAAPLEGDARAAAAGARGEAYRVRGRWRSMGRDLLWDRVPTASSAAALARDLHLSPQQLGTYLSGQSAPGAVIAWRIEQCTDGKVPASAWGRAPAKSRVLDGDELRADARE